MKKIAYHEMYNNELDHAWYKATRALMVSYLKKYLTKDAKILDAGCGTGGTYLFLKKANFTNIEGLDKNKEAIKLSHKRGFLKIKIGSINKIPYKEKSFDCVICLDVLYHKGVDPELATAEFFRVLKKGGVLYIQEPAYNWLKSKHDLAIETQRRFTKGALTKTLKNAGFKIEKATYYNLFFLAPIVIKRLKDKLFKFQHGASDVNKLTPLLNNSLYRSLSLERQILTRINLPVGLSVICIAKK